MNQSHFKSMAQGQPFDSRHFGFRSSAGHQRQPEYKRHHRPAQTGGHGDKGGDRSGHHHAFLPQGRRGNPQRQQRKHGLRGSPPDDKGRL